MGAIAIPVFSLEERERRWTRVRRLMGQERLDCLIAFPNMGHWDQFQADTRYLTQVGGNQTEAAVVFPLDGDVTCVVRGENEVVWWGMAADWVSDLRPSRRSWGTPVLERLRQLRLERGRIGVIGLSGLVRAPEGTVPWGPYEAVRAGLPLATFLNATPLMQRARAVKSAEEIAFAQRAEDLAWTAAQTMLDMARPGVPECAIYGRMFDTMLAGGGDIPTMILWGAGPEPPWGHRIITQRPLQAGDFLNNEIEAKWGGYIAQVVVPAVLGPVPDAYARMYEATRSIFEALCAALRPGVRFSEVHRMYVDLVRQAGYEPGGALLHGRGLGEDYPLIWGHSAPEEESVVEEGNVVILKPAALPREAADRLRVGDTVVEYAFRAGDTVAVGSGGARRLGTHPLRITELPVR